MTDEIKPLILIIEDDQQTRRLLKTNLCNRGWRVIEAENGKNGLSLVKSDSPDLVILDLGLPDIDGISVTKRLRQLSDLPILVLSARSQEQNKIMALDAGADDYLTKPFSTGELHARLQALLRRVMRTINNMETFQTGELTVELARRKVFIAGNEVHITPIEYRLLSILVRHAGLVVTHRQLLKEVWGVEHIHDQHYLRVYMGQLRHKLEINPARPRYLQTEVGVGYRLVDDEEC
ncbi:response regulator [Methylobacter sp.]|uniref:response regulator n=1 Tax=Methylobacter sp. TaxID=2051955 RepID=UPI002FDD9309